MELLANDHLQFQQEHKQRLAAQVVLTDRMDKLAVTVNGLPESRRHTDERLNALIAVVDDLVRKRPRQ